MHLNCIVSMFYLIPEDAVAGVTSNEVLQSPQVASTNDAIGAVQLAGRVVMYDNIRLKLDRTRWQSAVEQHPAVSDIIIHCHAGAACAQDVRMYGV